MDCLNGLVDSRWHAKIRFFPATSFHDESKTVTVYIRICRTRYPLVRQKSLRAFRSSPRLTTIEYIWIISKWTFAIPRNKLFSKQQLTSKKRRKKNIVSINPRYIPSDYYYVNLTIRQKDYPLECITLRNVIQFDRPTIKEKRLRNIHFHEEKNIIISRWKDTSILSRKIA